MRAAKVILGCIRNTSHTKIQSQLALPSLEVQRKIQLLTLFYKILYGLSPPYLSDNYAALLRDASRYSLRHPFNVPISFTRTSPLKKSFFHRAPMLWNTLPHEIQALTRLHAYVCRLKQYYDDISVQPNRLHLYGSDIKFVAINCMLRVGRSPLNISRSYRKCECGKTENMDHFYSIVHYMKSYVLQCLINCNQFLLL